MLRKYLGEETKLSQALTEILITSYEIETCRPYLSRGGKNEDDAEESSSTLACGKSPGRPRRPLLFPFAPFPDQGVGSIRICLRSV